MISAYWTTRIVTLKLDRLSSHDEIFSLETWSWNNNHQASVLCNAYILALSCTRYNFIFSKSCFFFFWEVKFLRELFERTYCRARQCGCLDYSLVGQAVGGSEAPLIFFNYSKISVKVQKLHVQIFMLFLLFLLYVCI